MPTVAVSLVTRSEAFGSLEARQLLALALLVLALLGWVAVQLAWRRAFPDSTSDDVLAARMSCGSCGCGLVCQRQRDAEPGTPATSPSSHRDRHTEAPS